MTAPPLSALQLRIFLLCALIVLLDGYDLQAMGLAVPALGRQWHLTPSAFTLAQSASLLGLGLGSAFIAPLGDRSVLSYLVSPLREAWHKSLREQ